VRLLERAVALVAAAEIDVGLETDLVDALFQAGRSDDALRQADALIERASVAGDEAAVLCGRIKVGLIRLLLGPAVATDPLAALLEQALPVFETARDDLALYHGYHALGEVENFGGQPDAVVEAFERAAAHARSAGLPYQLLEERALGRYFGATPVSDLLGWLDEQEARGGRDVSLRMYRGRALAMLGRFDEARALLSQLRADLADRGARRGLATATCRGSFDVELLAGDPAAAAEFGEEGCKLYEELGEKGLLSSAAVRLAQAYYALDRLEDAEAWAGRCVELGTSDDVFNEMVWRQVRAKILARRGEHAEAERLAREAVAIGEKTGILDPKADMYADVAEVFLLTGKPDEAAAALAQAHECYERKGNVVSAQRVQGRLAELHDSASR
jgi:tetratricopeptide (TPR) repeat protein